MAAKNDDDTKQTTTITTTPTSLPGSSETDQKNCENMLGASKIRRLLSNILLLLFRYHPSGILQSELPVLYKKIFGEINFSTDVVYLISIHKYINIINTLNRGKLYTLKFSNSLLNVLTNEFVIQSTSQLFARYIVEHILRSLLYFPNGIAFDCFNDTLYNLSEFKLSHIYQCKLEMFYFVSCIPGVTCFNFNNQWILSLSKSIINTNKITYKSIGYEDLFILLYSKCTANGIPGKAIEKLFYTYYSSRLCFESPYILSKMLNVFDHNTHLNIFTLKNRILPIINNKNMNDDNNIISEEKSPFLEDHVSVFMGGFGVGTTVQDIRSTLCNMGVTMISCTKIAYKKYGYSFVTVSDSKQADFLIRMSPINICGFSIEIRPFINRERVTNYHQNKPNDKAVLSEIIKLLRNKSSGLTVAEIQPMLFKRFSYRLSGSNLIKFINRNPKYLYLNKHSSRMLQAVHITPYLDKNVTLKELIIKINILWKNIKKNNEIITVHFFEYQFAKRYKHSINPSYFGFDSIESLLNALKAQNKLPFSYFIK